MRGRDMKITVIGGGNVGATTAQLLANKELANEICIIDVMEGIPEGKALDMYESMPILESDSRIYGSSNYEITKNSDIVIQTAGLARKPGMTRDDLLVKNAEIVSACIGSAFKYSPDALYIIVSNPLDVMTYVAQKLTKLPKSKVFGMAGILDTARYRSFISMELGVSMQDVQGMILGGHGDTMVPLPRFTTVAGIPVTDLIQNDKLEAIIARAAGGGGEIVKYLKTGSAYYAPAAAVTQMVESIVHDQKRILPCSVLLTGEYGYNDVVVGVPVVLGKGGMEKVIELKLNAEEKQLLDNSVKHVEETIKEAKELLKM
jgi:malate dehydrogenase